jgi:hypothetical protein
MRDMIHMGIVQEGVMASCGKQSTPCHGIGDVFKTLFLCIPQNQIKIRNTKQHLKRKTRCIPFMQILFLMGTIVLISTGFVIYSYSAIDVPNEIRYKRKCFQMKISFKMQELVTNIGSSSKSFQHSR